MERALPFLNTVFGLSSAILMIAGRRAIRRDDRRRHARLMIGAVIASTAFLIGFVVRYVQYGPTPIRTVGAARIATQVLLVIHEPIAVINIPLVLVALALALAGKFDAHRQVATMAWPIWLWSCATGAVVYVVLHLLPRP